VITEFEKRQRPLKDGNIKENVLLGRTKNVHTSLQENYDKRLGLQTILFL